MDPMLFSLVSSTSQVTSVKYCQHQQWGGIDEYRLFKYDYLPRSIDKSLYSIVVMIVCSFLPDTYQNYLSANLKEQCHHLRTFFAHNKRNFGNCRKSLGLNNRHCFRSVDERMSMVSLDIFIFFDIYLHFNIYGMSPL